MKCAVKDKCGGCSYIGLPYEKQLQVKQEKICGLLEGICEVLPIAGCENPYYYRNKVHAAFKKIEHGRIIAGTYSESSHWIVENSKCAIEDKASKAIILSIRDLAAGFKLSVYDERRGTGVLRRVLVRRAVSTGEIMVVIICGSFDFPGKKAFIKELLKKHPEITTICININNRRDSMILGPKTETVYGKGYITDELLGIKFRISPESFYQINHDQTEVLYSLVREAAGLTGKESVIDAYCGIGTIGLCLAQKAGEIIGVELNSKAVSDAVNNAKINGIKNAQFKCGDAGKFMVKAASEGKRPDVIILDPPRSGTTEEFIESCRVVSPKRIVYVSCGPETLARDLRLFEKAGFRCEWAKPVDMFPWTEHVETVCLLTKLHAKEYINIDLEMSELDITSAEKKASYEQIKEYVFEHTGLKVSHLNIAQIKRKNGIIERDCYNLPKSENSRQPNCTVEKEKAIVEALKHFKMI